MSNIQEKKETVNDYSPFSRVIPLSKVAILNGMQIAHYNPATQVCFHLSAVCAS